MTTSAKTLPQIRTRPLVAGVEAWTYWGPPFSSVHLLRARRWPRTPHRCPCPGPCSRFPPRNSGHCPLCWPLGDTLCASSLCPGVHIQACWPVPGGQTDRCMASHTSEPFRMAQAAALPSEPLHQEGSRDGRSQAVVMGAGCGGRGSHGGSTASSPGAGPCSVTRLQPL